MASKYIQKYPVPQGFPDILHDFAREVLRDQPENIYEFGYLYFKAMEEVSKLINYMAAINMSLLKFDSNCLSIGQTIRVWKERQAHSTSQG
jgi:hypothetical protein